MTKSKIPDQPMQPNPRTPSQAARARLLATRTRAAVSAEAKRSTAEVQSLLRRGLLAERAGDQAEARHWFWAVLDTDPDNITALLWLAWLAPNRQESLVLLTRVLELDPENERARAGVRWARRHLSTNQPNLAEHVPVAPSTSEDVFEADWLSGEAPSIPAVTPPPTTGSEPLHDTSPLPKARKSARDGAAARRKQRLIVRLGLLLAIGVCLLGIGLVLIAQYSPAAVLAWVLPTPTATPTPTSTLLPPTATATFAPTPTPIPTATATHTPVPTIAASPILTPTLLPATATPIPSPVSPPVAGDEKWIDVDLTHQQVTAYEGSTPVYQATVSTGLPNTPTVIGQFRIYWKLSATLMVGPGYYLPDVPYTMYFYRGYSLHGTYWHSNFGQPMSHGCVNLRTEDAEWLFNWADPPLPPGANQVQSTDSNPGTLVVIHK